MPKKKETTETSTEPTTETKYLDAISFGTEVPTITRKPMYVDILNAINASKERTATIDVGKLPLDDNGKARNVHTVYYGLDNARKAEPEKYKMKLHIRKLRRT